uniref:Uncharacterized protein n=1 Tax=Panagrolaimus sp. JU765 TaxID=591449 RepID=A0AC34REC1_9BILA
MSISSRSQTVNRRISSSCSSIFWVIFVVIVIILCTFALNYSEASDAGLSEADKKAVLKSKTQRLEGHSNANASAELRSDRFTNPDDLALFPTRPLKNYVVWISRDSWNNYRRFKAETCRNDSEESPNFASDDFLVSGFFEWEASNFHYQLRTLLFPETYKELEPLVGTGVFDQLDKRLFNFPMESLCKKHTDLSQQETQTSEESLFEDNLINRIFAPRDG